MNILQLTCHFSPNVGGVETHLDDLVKTLITRKHKVFVLTYRPLTTKTTWKTYEKRKNLQIFRIPWFSGLFYELVDNPAFEFLYLLPGLFVVTPFILSKRKFDVIHTHGLIAGFVGIFWGKIFKKKVVTTTHSIYNFPTQSLYTKFVRWIFLNSHAVLCLSKQSKEEVVSLDIPSEKVHIFTYWIDQKLFHKIPNAKKQLRLSDKFIVLFVGRLIPEKGIKVLLDSAKKWDKGVTLMIAGTGPLEDEILKNADGRKIVYAGKISQEKLALYYSAADILIVPSVHEEGFGRVLLESLSCGTPVIAAKRGGIVEAITDEVGYLIDVTPGNIKKVVEYCYKHRLELEDKSRKAKVFATKKFSEKNAALILKTYE